MSDFISSFDRPRIAVREKPITEEDLANLRLRIQVDQDKLVAFASDATEGLMYDCDYYFPCSTTQDEVYCTIGAQMVDLALQGLSCNAVVFGFTDTGKTHTLYGNEDCSGLIYETVKNLYHRLDAQSDEYDADICMRYWEMNRDAVEDSLREEGEEQDNIAYVVTRNSLGCMTIPNLTTVVVPTLNDFTTQLNRGSLNRVRRSHERSARWHGFLQLTITTNDKAEGSKNLIRTMTFVHMKGTDRVGAKGFRGAQLKEGSSINVSVTLLCAAIIHSLAYCAKRASRTTTPDMHRALLCRSQSFFMECKFSRFMSQLICGMEASFVIGCTSPLHYGESIETLESLQLFRRLRCVLKPILVVSDRGLLLRKLRRQEMLLGVDLVEELYDSDAAGRPLTEEEEKLLSIYKSLYGVDPRRGGDTVSPADPDARKAECLKFRAQPQIGKVEIHGLRKRIFLNIKKTATYEGQWEDGKFGGFGELIRRLVKYRGEFRNGLYDGEGTLWVRDDEKSPWVRVYQGDWLGGKRDGFGTSWDDNGDVYEGEWSEDKRNGFGRLFLANGDIIKGEFLDHLCDGRALLLLTSGDWYDGYWVRGIREGPGMWCYVGREQYLYGDWFKGVCRCGTMHDMPQKTTNERSHFIPRLGLLRSDEVLELERRKTHDRRLRELAAVGRDWVQPVIAPPLGSTIAADAFNIKKSQDRNENKDDGGREIIWLDD